MIQHRRVIFLDTVHPVLSERLKGAGYVCDELYTAPLDKILPIIHEYTGIVIRSRVKIDKNLLDAASNLRWIARSGAGMENIDTNYATQKGVKCYNSPEGNRDAVGEHAVGMLLMLMNNLKRADQEVRNGIWRRFENNGSELAGKTVGVIGYGQMGTALARKLSGFDCTVIAHDKYKSGFGNEYAVEVSLQELKEQADIISLHLPLSAETIHYIDENFIDSCGKSFYLVNTARGQNVSLDALLKGIDKGKVLGACLDVLEVEQFNFEQLRSDDQPEAFKQLVTSDKVLLSPHIAGWTHESYFKLSNVLADKILADFK